MPLIQIDLQPLSDQQRSELRSRVVMAVSSAIGSPPRYVSVVIRESAPANLVEAGGWGPYDSREDVGAGRHEPVLPLPTARSGRAGAV